jgi:membrane protease YdiL (CAAX protease family)
MAFEHTFPPPIAAAAAPEPPSVRTPWGYADMAKAIGVAILALVAIGTPAAVVAVGIAGGADKVDDNNTAMAVLEGASAGLQIILLAAVAWFSVRKYHVGWSALGLKAPERGSWWAGIVVFFAAILLFGVYSAILNLAGVHAEGNVSSPNGNAPRIILLAVLALGFAPFIEEVVFRGFLFGGLRGRWGPAAAAIASALLWSVAHFQDSSSLPLLPGIAIIGVLFAGTYYYTGSLMASVTAHLAFNALSFFYAVLLGALT